MVIRKLAGKVLPRKLRSYLGSHLLNLRKTAWVWDQIETAKASEYWWNFNAVRAINLKRITGDAALSWYTWQIAKRETPFGRILAFGDGKGMAIEAALTKKDVTEVIYVNISHVECQRFNDLFVQNSITVPHHCIVADANHYDYRWLGRFDTIISVGLFHHLRNFEKIFPRLNDVLNVSGTLFADEFIGPSQWRYEGRIIEQVNEIISALPACLVLDRSIVKGEDYHRLWKICGDSSESVRSGELHQALTDHFSVLETSHFGGTILFPLFQTTYMTPKRLNVPNWHETEEGRNEIARLAVLEESLIEAHGVPPHFHYYVLGKKR
ncbi:MAG: methyltransferase domain-containing protein [Chrysiogenales bacterium]|nr:MAG: methyltransferase domain-containing protein [Chrysiogenales bacterium]